MLFPSQESLDPQCRPIDRLILLRRDEKGPPIRDRLPDRAWQDHVISGDEIQGQLDAAEFELRSSQVLLKQAGAGFLQGRPAPPLVRRRGRDQTGDMPIAHDPLVRRFERIGSQEIMMPVKPGDDPLLPQPLNHRKNQSLPILGAMGDEDVAAAPRKQRNGPRRGHVLAPDPTDRRQRREGNDLGGLLACQARNPLLVRFGSDARRSGCGPRPRHDAAIPDAPTGPRQARSDPPARRKSSETPISAAGRITADPSLRSRRLDPLRHKRRMYRGPSSGRFF